MTEWELEGIELRAWVLKNMGKHKAAEDITALIAEVRRLRAQEVARVQAIRDMARPSGGAASDNTRWEVVC